MQISKLAFIASVAGAMVLQLQGQPASPELQNRALELLRQSLSQERSATSPAPQAPAVPPASQPPAVSEPATPPVAVQPVSSAQQEQAIQLLRTALAQERAAAPATPSGITAQTPSESGAASVSPGAAAPSTVVRPAPPEQPGAPKTKQQRLMELLEQYRADKLTPAQYHAERAKILAEP